MLKKKDEITSTIPVAPVATIDENIEFGFEHEIKELENNIQNNELNNINSALIKTYGNKTFKLNPYKDLNPVSIENANIQLSDSNEFLSGEVKAKVLDETLNDRSNLIKTPLIGDVIVDYEADKEGSQKRYDYTIELLKNENNKEFNSVVDYEDIQLAPSEFSVTEIVEEKTEEAAIEDVTTNEENVIEDTLEAQDPIVSDDTINNIVEERNELENKISDFDEVQTYICNDIEFSPREEVKDSTFDLDIELPSEIEEEIIDIRFKLEKASVNYYIFDKFKEKEIEKVEEIEKDELIDEEVLEIDDSIQEEPIEPFEDIGIILESTSIKFYEYQRRKEEEARERERKEAEEAKQRALKEALRKEQEEIENRIVEDILNSLEEGLKVEEAKKYAVECDLRIPSDVYILEVQNFIPLPEEPTAEMKAEMDNNLIDIENRLDELPMIIFRDNDEDIELENEIIADSYEKALESNDETEYYSAPIQDFNMYDTLGSVEETQSEDSIDDFVSDNSNVDRTRNCELSYEDIEEAFFNLQSINDSVAEVEKEANELGLNNGFDSGISLAKAAKIEALVEKKKAERKVLLAEERLQAELEKQQIEERIRAIQDKINLVKQMNFADFETEEVMNKQITEPELTVEIQEQDDNAIVPRRRGRPAGSKNKKTLLKEARERRKLEKLGLTEMPVVPKKRGRPLGSKNKKK